MRDERKASRFKQYHVYTLPQYPPPHTAPAPAPMMMESQSTRSIQQKFQN